jgi:PIN domain nuclease of toxin-antitoxin system
VRILLDTHIFLWSLSEPEKLDEKRTAYIKSPGNSIYVSSISIAEIMIKASVGKLSVRFDPVEMLEQCGFTPLDFTTRDAGLLGTLPYHHKDPFDRMLIAQGINSRCQIMTDDPLFRLYDCPLL